MSDTEAPGRWAAALAAGLILSGCSTLDPGPVLTARPVAAGWNAPRPQGERQAGLDTWWETFHDGTLLTLQRAAQAASPDLDRALAAIRRARADLGVVRAASQPQFSAQSAISRSGDLNHAAYTTTSVQHTLDASWETDLFGRNQRNVAALEADAEARAADWQGARVSLAAEVATDYIDYRGCRRRAQAYRDQDTSYRKTLALTRAKVTAGFTAPADYRLTSAGASATAANLIAEEARCDILVKSLVALSGIPEADLRSQLGDDLPALPSAGSFSVASVPADLIRQRPDLAAASRRAAAAYARIGASLAARWPDLTLSGEIGVAHTLLVAPSPWILGSTLTLPIFTAGADRARVDAARADYEGATADYDGLVRHAVLEVEVALVNLDGAIRREHDLSASAEGYRAFLQAAEIDWKAGRLPLLDLETARRNSVTAELLEIDVQTARVDQWIALYKALGGGWNRDLDVLGDNGGKP